MVAASSRRRLRLYALNLGSYVVTNIVLLLTYAAVTYAVLQRRVLDTQFVIGRALVFGTISTLVVASFVLLEWLLGHVLEGVSHTAGLAANVGLALALGLSMRFIHRLVDTFVDFYSSASVTTTSLRFASLLRTQHS